MKKKQVQFQLHRRDKDMGFSLVEVLVCIAILAVISIPIMAGFRASALYTNHAHKTQMVTAYAQEVLETVKSVEVDEFKSIILSAADEDGNVTGSVDESQIDTTLQAQFDSYSDEFFKKIICNQTNIDIGGEEYDMEVVFDPVDYSQKKDPSADAAFTSADDSNVYAVNEVESVDGMLFPVISDEISRYEGKDTEPGAALYNLLGCLKKSQLNVGDTEETRIAAIYQNLTKTVKVTISNSGAESHVSLGGYEYVKNTIKVTCDITYESEYNGVALKQVYNVFSGNYELLGRLTADGSDVEEWEKGGNVYLFARAYQDQYLGGAPKANIIEIENNYSGSGKLNLYLVRGCYFETDITTGEAINKRGLQFDKVSVNGTVYSDIPETTPLTGEWSDGNTYFHTNIKGAISVRQLQTSDFEQTIGMAKPSMRCYKVSIRICEHDSGDEVVNIDTTKELR